jgi:two-component system, cell cycle response regulator
MSLWLKLNLTLAACFLGVWCISAFYFGVQEERLIDDVVGHEARMQMETSMAVRSYTQEHIKPYFDANPNLGFHSFTVPAFASIKVLGLMHAKSSGYRYREVALNPTNPADLPNEWEREQIMSFKKPDAITGEVLVVRSKDDSILHAILPVRIDNPSCLQCHGRPEDAPKEMRDRYGTVAGFGWQLGEVVGAQIVTVPKTLHRARFAQQRRDFALALLTIFGLLFISSNVLFYRLMVRPMDRRNTELRDLAHTDALTRLPNRRTFDFRLEHAILQATNKATTLSVILIDIDHFKLVNDSFGHASGDHVLQTLSTELPLIIHPTDLFARLGGEEFGLLLEGSDQSRATVLAEAIRERCAKLDTGIGRPVTISLGVAQWMPGELSSDVLKRCDKALYKAKDAGRDVVSVAPP